MTEKEIIAILYPGKTFGITIPNEYDVPRGYSARDTKDFIEELGEGKWDKYQDKVDVIGEYCFIHSSTVYFKTKIGFKNYGPKDLNHRFNLDDIYNKIISKNEK